MSVYDFIVEEHKKIKENFDKEYKGTSQTIYNNCFTTVVSTFNWKKLPINIPRFLPEQFLYYWGIMGMFEENNKKYILPCTPSGTLTEYGEYDKYTLFFLNGKTVEKSREELALCYNNSRKLPSYFFTTELAEKMSRALNAVDITLQKALQPDIIECNTLEQLGFIDNMYNSGKSAMPYKATLSNALSKNEIKVHKVFDNRERDIISLWDIVIRYRNLFYTSEGVNNVEIQKRERLTEAEGSGNDEITRYTLLWDKFERRKDFVEEVKEKFGDEIDVEINRDSATVYQITESNEEKIEDTKLDFLKGVNTNVPNEESEEENDGNNVE